MSSYMIAHISLVFLVGLIAWFYLDSLSKTKDIELVLIGRATILLIMFLNIINF